jgi:3-hydroxyisobutyrate dehydrogenase-like beta-hydroxyacid dehydrogenase
MAFASGLQKEARELDLHAFDIKSDGADAAEIWDRYESNGVTGVANSNDLMSDSALVFSLVTADQAAQAARSAARGDLNGILFLDCNSCAPETKRKSAKAIEAAGGRYVDVAIITPVHPRLHKSPCLLAGPHAEAARDVMQSVGMSVELAGARVGDASTRKMIRSVMIKGLEALTLECFLAARKAGIEDHILDTLEASFPGFDWQHRAPYMMERMATHGIRRAAEMEEVAQTLLDLGITPHVTQGTVSRQREVGELGLSISKDEVHDLAKISDAILTGLGSTTSAADKKA